MVFKSKFKTAATTSWNLTGSSNTRQHSLELHRLLSDKIWFRYL